VTIWDCEIRQNSAHGREHVGFLVLLRMVRATSWKALGLPVHKGEYQRAIVRFMALICRYTGAARRLDPAWVEDRLEKRVMELMTFSQETSGASPPPPSLVAHTARVARYIDRKQRSDRLIISSFEHRTAAVVIWIRYYRPFVCDWLKV
jgi:hypothetical protein